MKKEKQTSAYEYLYATIKTADWISDEYKSFAEKYKDTQEPLRELYLCICDGVSIDVLELAEMNETVAEAFRDCRMKQLESDFIRRFSYDIKKLKNITTETKKEVKNMSGTMKQIADTIPTFDEMFMHDSPELVSIEVKEQPRIGATSVKISAEKVDDVGSVSETKPQKVSFKGMLSKLHRERPVQYIETLIKEGYSNEQINYILECLESGVSIAEIKKFASPKIDVELMKKLRNMKKEK